MQMAHSLAAHVLNMWFYIHPVAGYQCDRQIVELGGEKRELGGEGSVASAPRLHRHASLPGPPPRCEIFPHSHCSRINLLVSFSSGKPAGLFISPVLALRCLIFFFAAANWASRGNFISVSLVLGCEPPRVPAGARTSQSRFHRNRKEILARRVRDVITKFCWCENISLTMNLHTMAVIFHTPQANLILQGRSCLSAAAGMNHVGEGRKMHLFLYLFV